MWKRRAMNGLKGESFTETLRTLEKEEKEKKKTENRTKGPEEGRQRVREAKEKRRES